MDKEKQKPIFRLIVCIVIILLIFAGFIFRLYDWQIVHGEDYAEISKQASTYTETSYATRGKILTNDGVELATNNMSYTIVLNKIYMKDNETNSVIAKLISLCETCGTQWYDVLPILVDGEGYKFDKGAEGDVEYIKSSAMLNDDSLENATDIMNGLIERYDAENISDKQMKRNVVSVRYNMEKKGYSYSAVYEFAEKVSKEAISVISERTQNISAVEIRTVMERVVKNGTLIPHVVGVVGALSQEEYDEHKDDGYALDDKIGKFGIEASMEKYLRGEAGKREVTKDYEGNIISEKDTKEARPGDTVYLTIDSKLQKVANKSLASNVAKAQANGEAVAAEKKEKLQGEDCEAGAVVMLSVKDFSVLAAATYPSYDLGQYWDTDYNEWLYSDDSLPLYSRAFNGAFQPGSTFKPLTAIAALQEGIITPSFSYECTGHYNHYPNFTINCLSVHGNNDLETAIAKSCNSYFAEVGRLTGITSLYLYAEKFGLGMETGIEVDESTGILAGRDSEEFYAGSTCQAAIGQSDNTFTPVQLATYAATIANNGVRYRTHLVRKIVSYDGEEVILDNDPKKPEVMADAEIDEKNIESVKRGMRAVLSEGGTASSYFEGFKVKVAGKTGTAENAGSDHAVFICFAPYDKPEVAIAVVLEHGAWTRFTGAIARDLLTEYFK